MDKIEQNPRSDTGNAISGSGSYGGQDGSKTKSGVRGVYYYTTGAGKEDYNVGMKKNNKIDIFEGVSVYGMGERKKNKKLVN